MAGAPLTDHKDLKTGTSVWMAHHAPKPLDVLPAPLRAEVDVVIVGAGITGALLAETLTRRGFSVVVLDRRAPFHGSTSASTALLQFEIDTPLIELADLIGFENASRAWQRSYRAVGDLAKLVQSLGLACDFRPRRALYLSGNRLDALHLAEEGRRRQSIGLPSTFLGAGELRDLAGIDRSAALLSRGAADVDPVALTRELLVRALRRGAQICAPVELAAISPKPDHVQMITSNGVEMRSRAVVFATGYEIADGVPSNGHKRTSTWAFSTKPQPDAVWGDGELIWEASDPYLYIRTTADGRVIVGGEDEPIDDEVARDALLPTKIVALQRKTKQLFPALDVGADCAWTGTFGESDTGLPFFGELPDQPNCYAVLGYGGNGITFAVIASQVLAECLCGGHDPDAVLFAFTA